MTDPNNAQPPRHGIIQRTTGGSLARSWSPSLPRRRRCCVLLLLLLGLSAAAAAAAAAANNRCAVIAYAVCRVLRLCVCARLARSRPSTRSHQGTESSDGRYEARSLVAGRPRCRTAAAPACCCYCCWVCLLLLPIIVVLFLLLLCASVDTFV